MLLAEMSIAKHWEFCCYIPFQKYFSFVSFHFFKFGQLAGICLVHRAGNVHLLPLSSPYIHIWVRKSALASFCFRRCCCRARLRLTFRQVFVFLHPMSPFSLFFVSLYMDIFPQLCGLLTTIFHFLLILIEYNRTDIWGCYVNWLLLSDHYMFIAYSKSVMVV